MVVGMKLVKLGWILTTVFSITNAIRLRSHKSEFERNTKTKVYIGGLIPNASSLPSIQHAIRDINSNKKILPNHVLNLVYAISDCDVSEALQEYFDLVDILPRKLLLLNGLCSQIIQKIDQESRKSAGTPRILQVSYSNTDSIFDSILHASVFRLMPTEITFNVARILLLQDIYKSERKDLRIGLLYENSTPYVISHEDQVNLLLEQGMVGLESEDFEENASEETILSLLRRFKEKNVRIILGNFNVTRARQCLCLAYKEAMYGEKYTWILAGRYEPFWWRVSDACFPHEMERVMDGMLRVDISPSSFSEKKSMQHKHFQQSLRNSKLDGYAYDAVWAVAYALQNVSNFYSQSIQSNLAEDYLGNSTVTSHNPIWDEALYKSLLEVSFLGVTGRVSFDQKQGRGSYFLLVKQFQSLGTGYDEVNVGEYDSTLSILNMTKFPHRMIRKRSRILSSKSEFEEEHQTQLRKLRDEETASPPGVKGKGSNGIQNSFLLWWPLAFLLLGN